MAIQFFGLAIGLLKANITARRIITVGRAKIMVS